MSAIDLVQINVWLDVVFTTLYVIIVIALSIHFIGNIATGRAYRRFVKHEWPEHEGPEIPTAPKAMHFTHLACMFALGFSGMYIRFPFFDGGRTAMRVVHYVAMILVVVILVMRLWYAFYSKRRDYREFAVRGIDIKTAPQVVMYYAFIKKSKPHLGKYNVMQKATYISFVPLLFLQAFTGFALITNEFIFGFSPRDLLVGWWLGPLVGGTALAGAYARIAHYIVNWLFIILTTIHAYLSMTEDLPAFLSFFGLRHEGHEEEAQTARGAPPTTGHEGAQPALAEAD